MPSGTPSREQKDTRYFRLGGLCGMDFGVFLNMTPIFLIIVSSQRDPGGSSFKSIFSFSRHTF